ncbi:toxin glutamine deamidase domain-containing protein [Nocardia carnea]|uniref:toxin glutamine deamidase domain-containing protein n=1 Tax=Nocardia carnea TaxID=37328 RepID=UPI002456ECC3|nr:toxin glutamine deamidase domain-containing protein [Nocardia carnea]
MPAEAAGLDDFGTFSDVQRGEVPLAELRPQRVEMFDRAGEELSEAEQAAMRRAYENINRLLREAGGDPLSRYDLRLAIKNVNATVGANPADSMRSMRNCPEAALAVDDILRGKPAVAGPLPGAPTSLARGIYRIRAIDHPLRQDRLDDAENAIRDNPGSRGIVIAHGGAGKDHIFNIADVNGRVTYIDGVFGTTLETRPRYTRWFPEFDFYRTA